MFFSPYLSIFSHWLWHDSNWLQQKCSFVLLRGKHFNERAVSFIVHIGCQCFIVPDHMRVLSIKLLPEQCKNMQSLVLTENGDLRKVFERIENPEFIHYVLGTDRNSLFVSLPRFGLSFTYTNHHFHCQEIAGFYLHDSQHFKSLFGFCQYIILKRSSANPILTKTRIIVPDGDIKFDKKGGTADVQLCQNFGAKISWHKFDVHLFLNSLKAGSVQSRLYLAALSVITSFTIPTIESLQTGQGHAMNLIRQSWVSRTMSVIENKALSQLFDVCHGRSASLSLLCYELFQSSQSQSFLYETSSNEQNIAIKIGEDEATKM